MLQRRATALVAVVVALVLVIAVSPAAAAIARAKADADLAAAVTRLERFFDARGERPEALLADPTVTPLSLVRTLLFDVVGTDVINARREVSMKSSGGVSEFWRFVPKYEGSALLTSSLSWATACFGSVTVAVDGNTTALPDGSEMLGLTVSTAQKTNAACYDQYMFNVAWSHIPLLIEIETQQRAFLNLTGFTSSQRWLLQAYGVRMYTQNATHFAIYTSLIDTLLLFLPKITGKYDPIIEANNMLYLNEFARFQPPVTYRAQPGLTGVNASDINDGDVLFCSDMQGLGTSIALGSGGTPNHVAVCLRDDAGVLQVCESTDPVVVCTPYDAWIAQAAALPRTVVLAPLAPEFSANFDRTAAWAAINATLGFEYGYMNFIFGWLDTADRNFPCFPPDFQRCLVWEHLEYFGLLLERIAPTLATKFIGQALNHRVNATGLSISEALQRGYEGAGLKGGDIIGIVERDAWNYTTTRDGKPAVGKSMVCSTYACNALRAGGIFKGTALDGTLECTEQSPWNMQALAIYDTAKLNGGRPQVCQQRDPDNANCVLCGHTTFHLGIGPNQKPLTAGSGNHCPGVNPLYNRSADC